MDSNQNTSAEHYMSMDHNICRSFVQIEKLNIAIKWEKRK